MFFFIVIYIDHETILNIAKQIILIINSIDKLNFRFVKVFDYLQRFNLEIKHKLNKQHIVSNAFSKFVNVNTKQLLWKSFTTEVKKKRIRRSVYRFIDWNEFCVSRKNFNRIQNKFQLTENICYSRRENRERLIFFFIERTIWYFEKTSSRFTIQLDFVFFISSLKTYWNSFTKKSTSIILAVTIKFRSVITFANCSNIFAIIWNIVQIVWCIKQNVIDFTIHFNLFSRRRYFFTSSRWISF